MERGKADQVEKLIRKQYALEISSVCRGYFVLCNEWMPWFVSQISRNTCQPFITNWHVLEGVYICQGKPPQERWFDPRPVHVGFSVEKVPVGQIFIRIFWVSLYLVSILQSTLHIHFFIYWSVIGGTHSRQLTVSLDDTLQWQQWGVIEWTKCLSKSSVPNSRSYITLAPMNHLFASTEFKLQNMCEMLLDVTDLRK